MQCQRSEEPGLKARQDGRRVVAPLRPAAGRREGKQDQERDTVKQRQRGDSAEGISVSLARQQKSEQADLDQGHVQQATRPQQQCDR